MTSNLFLKGKADFEFKPSVESGTIRDRFLPDRPEVLAKSANPGVPIISGVNDMEGLLFFEGKLLLNKFFVVK